MPDPFRPYGPQATRLLLYGILQARALEWVAMTSTRGSSQPRYRTHPCLLHLPLRQAGSLTQVSPGSPAWSLDVVKSVLWLPELLGVGWNYLPAPLVTATGYKSVDKSPYQVSTEPTLSQSFGQRADIFLCSCFLCLLGVLGKTKTQGTQKSVSSRLKVLNLKSSFHLSEYFYDYKIIPKVFHFI